MSPLAAAAAWQLFMTADLSQHVPAVTEQDLADAEQDPDDTQRGFAEVITASDTAVSWWRSQMIAAALYQAEAPTFNRRVVHVIDKMAEAGAAMDGRRLTWRELTTAGRSA